MVNFDKCVEELVKRGAKRRLDAANRILQKSLQERTEEEVYASMFSRLVSRKQKQPIVLA